MGRGRSSSTAEIDDAFHYDSMSEPHLSRNIEIRKAHPEVRRPLSDAIVIALQRLPADARQIFLQTVSLLKMSALGPLLARSAVAVEAIAFVRQSALV
jgi:hypothetical protein